MTTRKALSNRLRFEIFKRDGFRCVYCGATPVDSVLHVDHVKPVADDGDNDPTNLVTACQQCNGGKSCVPLSEKRIGPTRTPEEAKDHAEQILAYLEAEKSVVEAKRAFADEVVYVWGTEVGWTLPPRERAFLSRTVETYGMANVVEAIRVAVSRIDCRTSQEAFDCFRYFCGIVRRWRESGKCDILPPPRDMKKDSENNDPVKQLLRLFDVDVTNRLTCELCGGKETSHIPSPIRIYEVLPRSMGIPVQPGNLVVLCEECCARNQPSFKDASEWSEFGLGFLPRNLFFRHVWIEEGRRWARRAEIRERRDLTKLVEGAGI